MNEKTWMCERCGCDHINAMLDYCPDCGWERDEEWEEDDWDEWHGQR